MIFTTSLVHKEQFLSSYLKNIKRHAQEKAQLIPYIMQNPVGVYIDLGAGSSGLHSFASILPDSPKLILVACDISQNTLDEAIKNNENYKSYIPVGLYKKNLIGLTIRTQKCNADNLPFPDNSISGVNSSSLLHEISSYQGVDSLNKSIYEVSRVLEAGGIWTYRDPGKNERNQQNVRIIFKNDCAKYFAKSFLIDFLKHNKEYFDGQEFFRLKNNEIFGGINTIFDKKINGIQCSSEIAQEFFRHFITFVSQIFRDNDFDKLIGSQDLEKMKNIIKNYKYKVTKTISNLHKKIDERFNCESCERYFYDTQDEFLVRVAENSIIDSNNKKFVLLPISGESIKILARGSYSSFIDNQIKIESLDRKINLNYIDFKSVVHFKKFEISEGFFSTMKRLSENKNLYPKFYKWIFKEGFTTINK